MGYRNSFDYSGQNQISGECAESKFEKLANKKGLKVKKANKSQQFAHIDFILIDKKNTTHLVDVKARKKVSRTSSSFSDDLVWIEFKNVSGNEGWLYGASDFIAFERESDFVIVPRANLVNLCENLVTQKRVSVSSEALYSKYTRNGRKDELSLIKMQDILSRTKTYIWEKEQ
jgi:hypothetical protein